MSTAALFFRKVVCALLPGTFWLKRRMRNGVIVTGMNKPGFGGRGFFVFGEALEPELNFLDHFLRKGDVFVDVGANSGVFSTKAAKCVQEEGCVLAIEPLPDMLYTLCLRLDELAAVEKRNRLDYLKIDVEGAESRILAGASGLIRQFKPIIQVEVTIDPVATLDEYVRCTYPGSPNCLLLQGCIKRPKRPDGDASPRRPAPPQRGRFGETSLPTLVEVGSLMQPCCFCPEATGSLKRAVGSAIDGDSWE